MNMHMKLEVGFLALSLCTPCAYSTVSDVQLFSSYAMPESNLSVWLHPSILCFLVVVQ